MKFCAVILLAAGSLVAASSAFAATADDKKWIDQCIKDNKDEGQTPAIIRKYCTCMNDKMSDNETQSITQWEKTHKKEEAACDKEAGWKR